VGIVIYLTICGTIVETISVTHVRMRIRIVIIGLLLLTSTCSEEESYVEKGSVPTHVVFGVSETPQTVGHQLILSHGDEAKLRGFEGWLAVQKV